MIKHVYVHIPFCNKICKYCDFCKKYAKNQNIDKYLVYIEKELDLRVKERIDIDSLYFGGGTPSILTNDQLNTLFEIINKYFIINNNTEVTFECNPEDISVSFSKCLVDNKVNRISLGIQTINGQILSELNRNHSLNDITNAIDILSKHIDNLSVDFMFDLPNEKMQDVKNNLNFITSNPAIKHVSYYSLILEKNTILSLENYTVDEEESVSKYHYINEVLKDNNFLHYEISNYGKIGYQSIHNQAYWQQKEYYGIGLGASGYIDNYRYNNTQSLSKYYKSLDIKSSPTFEGYELSNEDRNSESIMLNLRTIKGMKYTDFQSLGLKINSKLQIIEDYVSIKEEYLHISNDIIVDLFIEMENND